LDPWHKILIATIASLAGVIAALWRHAILTRREQDAKDLKQAQALSELHDQHRQALSELHDEHKIDIRRLTEASLKLGLSVIARVRPPAGSSESLTASSDSESKLEP
jgi:hypothetical protein